MNIEDMKQVFEDALPFAADIVYKQKKLRATFTAESGQQFGIGIAVNTDTDVEIVAQKIEDAAMHLIGTWNRVDASKPEVVEESVEESTEEE